ncbi:hypothetical protein ACFQ1S_42055, partial [Kibdelosporangium lantanae]
TLPSYQAAIDEWSRITGKKLKYVDSTVPYGGSDYTSYIVKDGLRRMYGDQAEDIYYYLTVYNEPYVQPAEPENLDVEGLLRGLYHYADRPEGDGPKAQILGSGVGMPWALKAQRMLKYAFNLIDDGLVGQQLFAGETTRLAYMTDEAVEGRDAFLEKRPPDWSPFPYYY